MSQMGIGPSLPGVSFAALETFLNQFWWGEQPGKGYYLTAGRLSSAAVDSGNTPTTSLRPGLLLGIESTNNEWKEWNPTGTDGSEILRGIVAANGVSTLNLTGTAEDKFIGWIATSGRVQASRLIVPGAASPTIIGSEHEYNIRRQMKKFFQLDDAYLKPTLDIGEVRRVVTADLTVTYAMNGMTFITTGAAGAVIFTLPAFPYRGLVYEFVSGADQNMSVVAATADTITTFNNLAADSVIFSTAGNKIGARVRVEGINGGSGVAADGRWLVTNLSSHTMTVVDA